MPRALHQTILATLALKIVDHHLIGSLTGCDFHRATLIANKVLAQCRFRRFSAALLPQLACGFHNDIIAITSRTFYPGPARITWR
jgi:hypothetical protein